MEWIETPNLLGEKSKHVQKILSFENTNVVNIQLQIGETIPEYDSAADTLIVVWSGKVSFKVEGKVVEGTSENILHIKSNERHRLTALEPSDLVVLHIMASKKLTHC
ncbi:hypothetical protein [Planococcus donghaensis]|uniref:Cupin n=1 Tax=Planococcus donghaensis TaxID=414778 RepID=A0A1C7EFH9_9BACL|nr:hypothetical protein [Planococcus donghaensis]ANU22157.1 hypothetical protein BCM40_01845 [Planococcus donghaensis]